MIARAFLLPLLGALLLNACEPEQAERPPYNPLLLSTAGGHLPNECAIVATEASNRLLRSGTWTRIVFIRYIGTLDHEVHGHAMTVYHPPASRCVLVYDADGTCELHTSSHEIAEIQRALQRYIFSAHILNAHFL